MTDDVDAAVRLRAFHFLTEQRRGFGEASIPRSVLERGFDFEGVRVPLIGPQGIFKPAILTELPLTITTAPPVEHRERPYDDGFIDGGFLRYRYRGTDLHHRDNLGLRTAMRRQTPLIYFHGVVQGLYEAAWIVGCRAEENDRIGAPAAWQFNDPAALTARRQYVTAVVRQRLHQRGFRQRVLRAYQQRCAICWLRHDELLEAAHILPDGHPLGGAGHSQRPCALQAPPRRLRPLPHRRHARPRRSPCASTCWRKSTGRCFSMACRAFRAGASTCRAPTTSSPIAIPGRAPRALPPRGLSAVSSLTRLLSGTLTRKSLAE